MAEAFNAKPECKDIGVTAVLLRNRLQSCKYTVPDAFGLLTAPAIIDWPARSLEASRFQPGFALHKAVRHAFGRRETAAIDAVD